MSPWWIPIQDTTRGICCVACTSTAEKCCLPILRWKDRGEGKYCRAYMLNTSQPFWDTKNQDDNPRRVQAFPGSYLFCKEELGLRVRGGPS